MAGIVDFAKRVVCLAVVAAFLFVTGVVAQLKPIADMAQGEEFTAFDGLGVADPYGWLAKSGGVTGVEAKGGVDEPFYLIANSSGGVGYKAIRIVNGMDDQIDASTGFSNVVEAIRMDAAGKACDIQLGNNSSDWLNIGSNTLIINGAVERKVKWGEVRISGKLRSTLGESSQAIVLLNGASVVSSVEIETGKAVAVQVNDSSKFTYIGATNTSGGNIVNTGANGSTVTVKSGYVTRIDNEGRGNLEITGGKVGDISNYKYAIKNAELALTVISGNARIVSGDTSNVRSSGTILNSGTLEISGGEITNDKIDKNGYSTVINNGYEKTDLIPIVKITGTARIFTKNRNDNAGGAIYNHNNSEVTISGGTLYNDDVNAGTVISNEGKLVISDSAVIESRSAKGQTNMIFCSFADSAKSGLSIIGGIIIADKGQAVQVRGGGRFNISGNADISNNDPQNATVYVSYSARLRLYGGTIKSLAANSNSTAVAIGIYEGGQGGPPGRLELGGSPIVTGLIQNVIGYDAPIKICTDKDNEFKPNNQIYRIQTSVNYKNADYVILKNGAGVIHSFASDTSENPDMELAVNGDDVYVTVGRPYKVKFNLNGSIGGDIPKTIPVIPGGSIGAAAKPKTDGYLFAERTKDSIYEVKNDGEWHISSPNSSGGVTPGDEFEFGVTKNATRVNSDLTLTLSWTGEKKGILISVLESSRDLPVPRSAETAAIAPAAASSGSLTAGPIPVSRSSGAVNFFRSGTALKNGKLFIYDASGNMVTTVSVSDPSGGVGRRPVASWNLQDAKGRNVAEGTYVARGVVTAKAGKTERVSVLINVQK